MEGQGRTAGAKITTLPCSPHCLIYEYSYSSKAYLCHKAKNAFTLASVKRQGGGKASEKVSHHDEELPEHIRSQPKGVFTAVQIYRVRPNPEFHELSF